MTILADWQYIVRLEDEIRRLRGLLKRRASLDNAPLYPSAPDPATTSELKPPPPSDND